MSALLDACSLWRGEDCLLHIAGCLKTGSARRAEQHKLSYGATEPTGELQRTAANAMLSC